MDTFAAILLVLAVLTALQMHPAPACETPKSYDAFITNSCNTTTYPPLCVRTIAPYAASVKASPYKLRRVALKVAVNSTSGCAKAASKLAHLKGVPRLQAMALKDCIEELKDAVYNLKRTEAEMRRVRDATGADGKVGWENAKTYASAAITDAETCVDGLLESSSEIDGAVLKTVKGCVDDAEKMMSNALALINPLH